VASDGLYFAQAPVMVLENDSQTRPIMLKGVQLIQTLAAYGSEQHGDMTGAPTD
jgi:hypothetical protein